MLAGMRRNDRREADESAQHLLLGGGPVEQVVEQRITYERTCVRTQGGRNRIVREIIQDRAQRQAGPIGGRAIGVDGFAAWDHVVRVWLDRVPSGWWRIVQASRLGLRA